MLALGTAILAASTVHAAPPEPTREALRRVIDLDIGSRVEVLLANGARARVRLINVSAEHDRISNAVRRAKVQLEVNGVSVTVGTGNYELPVTVAGVKIDCPVIQAYNAKADVNFWSLEKDARLRLWPADSPLLQPGTFGFPLRQRWLASSTQISNEPVYVDGYDTPARRKKKGIYYHCDLDFGGAEGLDEVIAATDGVVVSVAGRVLPGYEGAPVKPRYDVVALLDDRGWYYRYSHLNVIDPSIQLGAKVKLGQNVGILGKEGQSGGWSHLHFGITSRQPSGKWGAENAYAYAWEAYRNEHRPGLVAIARPHHSVMIGEKLTLDGTNSWSASGKIVRYSWTFTDGGTAAGATTDRSYARAGSYSEILKVTDTAGNVAYDFAVVQVHDPAHLEDQLFPTLHASYWPTLGLRAKEPAIFKVRCSRSTHGHETWDFGDGTPPVQVKSDGNVVPLARDGYALTTHAFERSGTYLVKVEREDEHGQKATSRLLVVVQ